MTISKAGRRATLRCLSLPFFIFGARNICIDRICTVHTYTSQHTAGKSKPMAKPCPNGICTYYHVLVYSAKITERIRTYYYELLPNITSDNEFKSLHPDLRKPCKSRLLSFVWPNSGQTVIKRLCRIPSYLRCLFAYSL